MSNVTLEHPLHEQHDRWDAGAEPQHMGTRDTLDWFSAGRKSMRNEPRQRDHSVMPAAYSTTIFGLDCSQDKNNARWACPMCCFLAGGSAVLDQLVAQRKFTVADAEQIRNHLAMTGQEFP